MAIWIGNTQIGKIDIGSSSEEQVYVGSTKVWGRGHVYTYTLTDITVRYSSGTYLSPTQSNYATVTGVYRTFEDGRQISAQTVTITSMSANYTYVNNGRIYFDKDNYGTRSLSQQSVQLSCVYGSAFTYGSVTIGANSLSYNRSVVSATIYPTSVPAARTDIAITNWNIQRISKWTSGIEQGEYIYDVNQLGISVNTAIFEVPST